MKTEAEEEETLVEDRRFALTPVEWVEQKLLQILQGGTVPVSQLQRLSRNSKPQPKTTK